MEGSILIVEPLGELQSIHRKWVADMGHFVSVASGVAQALAMLRDKAYYFDGLVIDQCLEDDLTGLEIVIKVLTEDRLYRPGMAIALIGENLPGTEDDSAEVGILFAKKPITFSGYKHLISELLGDPTEQNGPETAQKGD